MKAEDLMIGDWVRLKDDSLSYEESCMKLTFLSNSTMCSLRYTRTNIPIGLRKHNEDWLCPIFIDDIEPIPITKEILEKNGILYEKQSYYYVIKDDKDLECTYYIQQIQEDWAIGVDIGAYDCSVFARIKYVHELQHALKLCGIDKEIVV